MYNWKSIIHDYYEINFNIKIIAAINNLKSIFKFNDQYH
jgi:hypothetical protein